MNAKHPTEAEHFWVVLLTVIDLDDILGLIFWGVETMLDEFLM